jgi:hypothetical protein
VLRGQTLVSILHKEKKVNLRNRKSFFFEISKVECFHKYTDINFVFKCLKKNFVLKLTYLLHFIQNNITNTKDNICDIVEIS